MYCFNLGLRFERIVAEYSDHTALSFAEDKMVTYHALNSRANQAARFLRQNDLNIGDVVCLEGDKSELIFSLLLACLKIGAPYVVLDPESPVERLRKIIVTCQPRVILGRESFLQPLLQEGKIEDSQQFSIDSDVFGGEIESMKTENLPHTRLVYSDTPAYIMYTSGSTGFPKGAVMTHMNVLNLIDWSREQYDIVQQDILTNVNPLYFDNSVFDFYSALFNGASLVPFSKREVQDPKQLVDKIESAGCTLWFSVPSLLIYLQNMRAANGQYLRSIKRFSFGGEGYPKAKLKQLFDTYKDTAEFFNVYGPTECTCICSSYKLSDTDFEDVQGLPPLGYMAPNFGYLILDEQENNIPQGEAGELCLLGPQVGKGYYNDPERTAQAFKQNPHNNEYYEIMYKTGDMVCEDPNDGMIYVQGRKDNQIKHMGYRIELEEIESALHCLEYVSEAAVLYGQSRGMNRIVCVFSQHRQVDDEQIKTDLRQIIPSYMLPDCFYREDMLPKNSNGKLDRLALKDKYLQKNRRDKIS